MLQKCGPLFGRAKTKKRDCSRGSFDLISKYLVFSFLNKYVKYDCSNKGVFASAILSFCRNFVQAMPSLMCNDMPAPPAEMN